MRKPIIIETIAVPILLLFFYTGVDKLEHFQNFKHQLQNSPWLLLSSLSGTVAWALPLIELTISAMLVWPSLRKAGFITSALLFIVFIVYISVLLGSGKKLPCSCGGIIAYLSWKVHLGLNLLFLALSFTGLFLERSVCSSTGNIN